MRGSLHLWPSCQPVCGGHRWMFLSFGGGLTCWWGDTENPPGSDPNHQNRSRCWCYWSLWGNRKGREEVKSVEISRQVNAGPVLGTETTVTWWQWLVGMVGRSFKGRSACRNGQTITLFSCIDENNDDEANYDIRTTSSRLLRTRILIVPNSD